MDASRNERLIEQRAKQLAARLADALRANPRFWGRASLDLTIQDGQIRLSEVTTHETVKEAITA